MKSSSLLTNNAHWLLRISIVSAFFYHGTLMFLCMKGFENMLPVSFSTVVLVAMAQMGGSILLLFGGLSQTRLADFATRLGALLNIPIMIAAIAFAHWGHLNFAPAENYLMGGIGFQVVLLLIMSYVAIKGNVMVEKRRSSTHRLQGASS